MWMLGVLAILLVSASPSMAQASATSEGPASGWSLTGEARQQYEWFDDENWGAATPDSSGYFLQRYMLRVERPLGERARAVVEFKSGIELGRAGGPRLPDEDYLDLHQGYVEVGAPNVMLRVGRQELQFGSSRLVSVRDLNVRQSFDGARLIARMANWRLDSFATYAVQTRRGIADDATDQGRVLWGVYAVRSDRGQDAGLDLYYLGYHRQLARYDSVAGPEQRHTSGIRWWGRARQGRLDYNAEAIGQWGSVGASSIRAWTIATDTGYQLELPLRPRLGTHADITSGDVDPRDRQLSTFNALFPRGAYFGQIAPVGPSNHLDLHPQIDLQARSAVITLAWLIFWRTERSDGIYTVSGQLLRSSEGAMARFVGHSPSLSATWLHGRVTYTAQVAMFTAGTFIRQTGDTENTHFIRASATYRF